MARSTVTVSQVIADARAISGALDSTKPTQVSMIAKYNLANAKIFKLLNGSKGRRFMAHCPLGNPSNYLAVINDSSTFSASTKVIAAPSVTNAFIGGLCFFWSSNGGFPGPYFGRCTGITAGVGFNVDTGWSTNAPSVSFILLAPPTGLTHSIANYRADNIIRVDFPISGNAPRVNEDVIESVSGNPNYALSSAVVHTGISGAATVKVVAGSSLSNNGGFPVVFFEEKPYKATAVTDYVDLPLEYQAILVEEMARMTLLELGSTVPKALENPMLTLDAVSQSYQATQDVFLKSQDAPK